jgi:hypothetical protein
MLIPFLAFILVVFIVGLMLVSLLVLFVSLALLLAMTLLLLLLFVMFGSVAGSSLGPRSTALADERQQLPDDRRSRLYVALPGPIPARKLG